MKFLKKYRVFTIILLCFSLLGIFFSMRTKAPEVVSKTEENFPIPLGAVDEKPVLKVLPKEEKEEKKEPVVQSAQDLQKENTEEKAVLPTEGAVIFSFSKTPVYSKTMNDFRSHTALDFSAKEGQSVYSVKSGTTEKVGFDKAWGYVVEISHDNGLKTIYKNLSENVLVQEGESVKAGQKIGEVGTLGIMECKDESHLHFEATLNGEKIDFTEYF